MKISDAVRLFLLGMITAFLAVIALRPQSGAFSADDGVRAGDLIAVTGPDKATLFLVDTNAKQIAQYGVDNARFSLRGARHYSQDLKVFEGSWTGTGIDVEGATKWIEKNNPKK